MALVELAERRSSGLVVRLFWDREEIRAKLADKLTDGFDRVCTLAEQQRHSLRSAALVVAIREVAGALEVRGIYP